MHYYLNQHPDLVGSNPKELHFFENEVGDLQRRMGDYRRHFKSIRRSGAAKYFETTPNYLYSETAARNMATAYPDIKLVAVLREPVSRAYSAWNMYYNFFQRGIAGRKLLVSRAGKDLYRHLVDGRTSFPTLMETIAIERQLILDGVSQEPSILRRGLYFEQINTYLKYFDREQLLILGYGDLVLNPDRVCETILIFLGLNENSWPGPQIAERNKIGYSVGLSGEEHNALADFYRESNENLWRFLGYKLNW